MLLDAIDLLRLDLDVFPYGLDGNGRDLAIHLHKQGLDDGQGQRQFDDGECELSRFRHDINGSDEGIHGGLH